MPSTSAESSFLLWSLGALISLMGAHVVLGWARQSQFLQGWRRWGGIALCAIVYSTSFGMASELGLAGEALAFPIGYRAVVVLGVWAGAFVLAMPIVAWLVWRPGMVAAIGAGALLAALTAGIDVGWTMAVGFRPGLKWRWEFVALGAIVMGVGMATAFGLAFPRDEHRQRPLPRRLAAATLMGLATLAGQALVLAGAGLQTQVGSLYRSELSGSLMSLIGGALVPMALALIALDLALRRRERRARRRRHRSRRYREAARRTAPDALAAPAEPATEAPEAPQTPRAPA